MKLFEFFGKAISSKNKESADRTNDKQIGNDVFWFILDHDKIYKDYFIPLATKIKKDHEHGKLDKEEIVKKCMPMVKKGCLEFYQTHKMQGKISKLFPEELRKEICEKLFDHYKEHILKDRYKLGQ